MNPGDSQVTEDLGAKHLAETQPYNDKKLQSCHRIRFGIGFGDHGWLDQVWFFGILWDGTHRVVYGTQLKDITGKVKMVAWDSAFSLLICSWVKSSQAWSFPSL
jgi:hypothetical protein